MAGSLVSVDIFLSVTKIFTRIKWTIIMMYGFGGCGYCWRFMSRLIVLLQVDVAGKIPVT